MKKVMIVIALIAALATALAGAQAAYTKNPKKPGDATAGTSCSSRRTS